MIKTKLVTKDAQQTRLRLHVSKSLAGLVRLSLAIAFLFIAGSICTASATTRYVAQSAGVFSGGTACNGQTAITVSTWNGLTLSAGDLTWVCGTITIGANATGFNFGSNHGSSGNPIILRFDTGAILQSAYFASSAGGTAAGGITLGNGNSYIVIDGNNTGTIQNTANGSPSGFANHQASTGISGFSCTGCTVENLTISNIYVNVINDGTLGDNSVARAIDYNGSNWTISGNTIHDCGWCLFDAYNNGDTNEQVFNNNIYNMGHGQMFATAAANTCTSPCLILHDNHIHDAINWQASGCPFHQDGLHTFGIPSGSSMDGLYVYNNLFDGDWGTCPTGFVFVEAGGGAGTTPSHLKNSYWWNNVGVVSSDAVENTNGWFNISSGDSGVQKFYDNTIIGKTSNDNTNCWTFEGLSALTFENNAISNCGNPIYVQTGTVVTNIDYNFYGTVCGTGNCFILGASYGTSFSGWKSLCGCDSHGVQNSTPVLNIDGSPQSSSPDVSPAPFGLNLMSIATGNLASLSMDTTKGNTRTAVGRPGGSTAWVAGAYQTGPNPPNPPTGLSAVVQ